MTSINQLGRTFSYGTGRKLQVLQAIKSSPLINLNSFGSPCKKLMGHGPGSGPGQMMMMIPIRRATNEATGAVLPEPSKVPLGMIGITGTVTAGLLLGAAISKNIASFLEENELFVPADDDDDD